MRAIIYAAVGVVVYLAALLYLGHRDGGSAGEALLLAVHHLTTPQFRAELVIVAISVCATFLFATSLAFIVTPFRSVRCAANTAAVLCKVTPALALTPILRRALPDHLQMDLQYTIATIVTGVLIGFYPIYSTAVHMYDEAASGAPGTFARTMGASVLRAHVFVLGSYLLRGALIGAVTGFPLAVIGVIVGEMITSTSTPNIGYQIMNAVNSSRTTLAIAAVLAATVLGFGAYLLGRGAARAAAKLGDVR